MPGSLALASPSSLMADAHTMLFPRFSAARVATALKDTPVVMVNRLFAAPLSALPLSPNLSP